MSQAVHKPCIGNPVEAYLVATTPVCRYPPVQFPPHHVQHQGHQGQGPPAAAEAGADRGVAPSRA